MFKMKKTMERVVLCLSVSILTGMLASEADASDANAFLTRSSETIKFKAKKAEEIHMSCRDGFFRKLDLDKLKIKEAPGNNNNTPEGPDPSGELTISSQFLEAQNAYKLTITCTIEGDGILSNKQQLNQAPADGFTQSTEIILPIQKKAYEAQKYIYTKIKSSGTYQHSRLELNMIIGKSKLIIDMDAFSNPDGTPNLKYDKKHQQKVITQRRKEIEEAIKNKTATDEQIEELHELSMMQMQDQQDRHSRWDFEGNRRRTMKQKRQKFLEADGRIRPKKRTIKKEE